MSTDALPELNVADLDRVINKGIVDKTYSAAACCASQGKTLFHRAVYGSVTQPPPFKKIDFDAVFDLASLSKPLGAGLAALYLAGKNRLDLSVPLSKTLPEFADARWDAVTLDMLLDHTSGFPALTDLWQKLDAKILGTRETLPLYKKQIAQMPFAYAPQSQTIYSDVGFIVLGLVIENVVKTRLDVFLEKEIYRPLGLHNDLFFVPLDDLKSRARVAKRQFVATEQCAWRKKLVQGEVHDPNAWAMGGVAGHAGLFGTLDGVYKLMQVLLACYKAEQQFFHPATVQRFWTRSKRPAETTRTLAWDTPSAQNSSASNRFSRTSVGHLGFTGTSIWLDLKTDVMGVVLTNAAHPSPVGKKELMAKLRPRLYELIGGHGEMLGARRNA